MDVSSEKKECKVIDINEWRLKKSIEIENEKKKKQRELHDKLIQQILDRGKKF